MSKVIIISAPSGTGKGTIIARLMAEHPELRLRFSISATSRPPRGQEQHGREYYFFSPEEFRAHIEAADFLEYEEVYKDRYYGTLKSEVERISLEQGHVIFEVDYVGALNIKRAYQEQALAIFIKPPSLSELRRRLEARATDSPEIIEERLNKAEQELSFADQFDLSVVNDDLEVCVQSVYEAIASFLKD